MSFLLRQLKYCYRSETDLGGRQFVSRGAQGAKRFRIAAIGDPASTGARSRVRLDPGADSGGLGEAPDDLGESLISFGGNGFKTRLQKSAPAVMSAGAADLRSLSQLEPTHTSPLIRGMLRTNLPEV